MLLDDYDSGRQDLNLRLRGPKPRALARLSYAPGRIILLDYFVTDNSRVRLVQDSNLRLVAAVTALARSPQATRRGEPSCAPRRIILLGRQKTDNSTVMRVRQTHLRWVANRGFDRRCVRSRRWFRNR